MRLTVAKPENHFNAELRSNQVARLRQDDPKEDRPRERAGSCDCWNTEVNTPGAFVGNESSRERTR